MKLPYVIDNQTHVLAEILMGLLTEHKGRSLDVATAYFTVGGFGLVREGLMDVGNFRLLLGAEPRTGEQIGLRPDAGMVRGLIRKDLEELPFDESTLRLVEDLIAYLQRESVQVRLHDKGFLHAKCWFFYSDRPGQQMLFDRFRPILAIVGSSNLDKFAENFTLVQISFLNLFQTHKSPARLQSNHRCPLCQRGQRAALRLVGGFFI
jgi:hypothetical protein